ncbi:transcription antitermination factor NusB [Oceanivirga miroungae]|uniref:NusB antitermination factor n=1 Tax=Oceanivirga miroungae TaxID=1130046 RepID=A0A6I8MEU2_9FUSO|nr:transcription antitermination factor NusB [Oceanivirga miroungae]VWL85614.1 NusB antitermination factor [Oceanivirga miroungae]
MQKKLEIRVIREEIFKILFEHELIFESDTLKRVDDFIIENEKVLNKSKEDFLKNYIKAYIENENKVIDIIKENLEGWTFERLGAVERVLLKMSFYEIKIKNEAFEIAINEAVELSKIYGDEKTKKFINGILAALVKGN